MFKMSVILNLSVSTEQPKFSDDKNVDDKKSDQSSRQRSY